MDAKNLPFKVGEMVELKSFKIGFRSAWFRSKITSIKETKGKAGFYLKFVDYPDERITWTQLYQKCFYRTGSSKEKKMELMVRPAFPCFYCESEAPLESPSQVMVVVHEMWKVGHLVDWLCEGCYWSGRITKLLGEHKVLVELPQPPVGEGESYEALSKDLRPSLDWSLELGWTVPSSMRTEDCRSCARLVQPCIEDGQTLEDHLVENGSQRNVCIHTPCQNSLDVAAVLQRPPSGSVCAPSLIDVSKEEKLEVTEHAMDIDHPKPVEVDSQSSASSQKPNSFPPGLLRQSSDEAIPETNTSLHVNRMVIEVSENSDDREPDISCLPDASLSAQCEVKYISGTGIAESSRRGCDIPQKRSDDRCEDCSASAVKHSDPLELSIMELEELASKIAWLKGLLKVGIDSSNSMNSSWKL